MIQSNPLLLRIVKSLATDPQDAAFLYDILANPADTTTPAIYADWLEQRGDLRGTYMHLRHEQIRAACEPKRWDELQRGKDTIRPGINPLWLGFVMREGLPGTVARIEEDGFFVDLGDGLEGQVSISDMPW